MIAASRVAIYRDAPVDLENEDDNSAAVVWAADRAVKFMGVLDDRLRKRAKELKLSSSSPDVEESEAAPWSAKKPAFQQKR
jgi:hypothetical protein